MKREIPDNVTNKRSIDSPLTMTTNFKASGDFFPGTCSMVTGMSGNSSMTARDNLNFDDGLHLDFELIVVYNNNSILNTGHKKNHIFTPFCQACTKGSNFHSGHCIFCPRSPYYKGQQTTYCGGKYMPHRAKMQDGYLTSGRKRKSATKTQPQIPSKAVPLLWQ